MAQQKWLRVREPPTPVNTPEAKLNLSKPDSRTREFELTDFVLEGKSPKAGPPTLAANGIGAFHGLAGTAKRRRARKSRAGKKSVNNRLPPSISVTPMLRHTFRFEASSAVNAASLTVGNFLAICGGMGTTGINVEGWASSMRIHKITMWPGVTSGSGECYITWNSPQTKDELKLQSLPGGITQSGAVVSVPPAGSFAAGWWNNNQATTALAALDCPTGSIVDVDISFTLSNEFGGTTNGVTTAVIGTVYYLYLDGSTSHKLVPLGLTSTF